MEEEFIEKVPLFIEPLLKQQENFCLLIGFLLLFLFIIWVDRWYGIQKNRRLAENFRKKYPDAALCYLYFENQPMTNGKAHCTHGTISPLFLISAKDHTQKRKGLAFYAVPEQLTINLMVTPKEKGKKKIITTNPISFSVEENASYQLQVQPAGWLKISLLKGQKIPVVVQQQPVEKEIHAVEYVQKLPVSTDIVKTYRVQELKRVLTSIAFIYLLLGPQVWLTNLPEYIMLVPLVLCMAVLLKIVTVGTRNFNCIKNTLPERSWEQIQIEFQRPHPIYKLFLGEVHLLKDCLICRHGGVLSLILLGQIATIQKISNGKTYGTAKSMVIKTKDGRKYTLEFFGKHKKELALVQTWIQDRNPNVMEL